MISDWYRVGEQKVTGGYKYCLLTLPDGQRCVDNQGGCCDNDVHEIFKCIEETVFRKAFIHQNSDSSFFTCGCYIEDNTVRFYGDKPNELIYNISNKVELYIEGKKTALVGFNTLKF